MPTVFLEAAAGSTGVLASVITADLLNGLFDEIKALLPVLLPAAVGYLSIRKGWSFIMGILRRA